MTPQQTATLAALRRLYARTGLPVTTRQLADAVGLASNGSAHRHVTALVAAGLARRVGRAGFAPVDETVALLTARVRELERALAERR